MPVVRNFKIGNTVYAIPTYANATQSMAGLMPSTDKTILDSMSNFSFNMSNNAQAQTVILDRAKAANMLNCECVIAPIVAETRTANLLNTNEIQQNAYIKATGEITAGDTDRLGPYIAVSPGDDIYYTGYTDSTAANSKSFNRRLHAFDSSYNWIKQIAVQSVKGHDAYWSVHGTMPANTAYVCVSWNEGDYQQQITIGAPNGYVPYYINAFSTLSTISLYVSQDETDINPIHYDYTLPNNWGSVYGCIWYPTQGKIKLNIGYIASYNEETLPGVWMSNKDVYQSGRLPTIGAEVVYELAEEDIIEYTIPTVTIPLAAGDNILWLNQGYITNIEYIAQTIGFEHLTANTIRVKNEEFTDSDVINWKQMAEEVPNKAPINGPTFTGLVSVPDGSTISYSKRASNNYWVQLKLGETVAQNDLSAEATKPYSPGQFICVRGKFCKVIDDIAIGDLFVDGENIQFTTVGEQLELLFAALTN